MSDILLSVWITAYNHELFIHDCLQSVVGQQVDFKFEVIVHDDASTDNTTSIIKEYEAKFPKLFKCIYQFENQFKKHNSLINILQPISNGKYIALCDGDDYWTDPLKLQKQVDFLEANEDYTICTHNVRTLCDATGKILSVYPGFDAIKPYKISDLCSTLNIHTCSFVFKKDRFIPVVDWFAYIWHGDFFIAALLLTKGYGINLPETMATYRYTTGGQSIIDINQRILLVEKNIFGYNNLLCEISDIKDRKALKKRRQNDYWQLLDYSSASIDRKRIIKYLLKCFFKIGSYNKFRIKLVFIALIKFLLPFNYNRKQTVAIN